MSFDKQVCEYCDQSEKEGHMPWCPYARRNVVITIPFMRASEVKIIMEQLEELDEIEVERYSYVDSVDHIFIYAAVHPNLIDKIRKIEKVESVQEEKDFLYPS